MEFWAVLGEFRQPKNGLGQRKNRQQWKKTANTDVFQGFGMLGYWTHCKNQCFGPTLYWKTRQLCSFWRKDWNNTVRTCVLDRLYAQKCKKIRGCWRKTIKRHCKSFLKHVQYLYTDWTKKLAVWVNIQSRNRSHEQVKAPGMGNAQCAAMRSMASSTLTHLHTIKTRRRLARERGDEVLKT